METMTLEDDARPNPAWKIALVVLPAFLVLSTAVSIWVWWKRGIREGPDPRLALAAGEVSEKELLDHIHKLTGLIGKRDWESEAGRRNLRRTAAFIDGTLGPQNYGFAVKRGPQLPFEGELWPVLSADHAGSRKENVLFVVVPYDAEPVPIALALAAANDLRDEKLPATIRFVFSPAALAPDSVPVPDLLAEGESGQGIYPLGEQEEYVLAPSAGGAALVEAARKLASTLRRLASEG